MLELFHRFSKTAVQIVPQCHHIITADTVVGHWVDGAILKRSQPRLDARFIELIAQQLVVEIVEPGVGQDLGQVYFAKQLQGHRVIRRGCGLGTGKPRDQTGGLFAAAHRVNFLDEVNRTLPIASLQRAIAARSQG